MSNNPPEAKAPSPPPAPPLPPQRSGFTANAFARIAQPFGYGTRTSNAPVHRPTDSRPSRLNVQRNSRWDVPLLRSLFKPPKVPQVPQVPHGNQNAPADNFGSPIPTRTTEHRTGIPIAALDISPDRTHAVLAGRGILKTIQVSDSACAEDFNLRTNIIAYAATHESSSGAISAKHKDQLAANDVKWSHGNFRTTIATAAANGQIVVYDINRAGVEMARLHEHNRQVHKLGFNPHQGYLMLSGSQDATIRLWDLRALAGDRSVMTCNSSNRYMGNSDGIRDLKWSPTDGVGFAVGTDNGMIQRWDIRYEKAPFSKINAHEKTCHSIDWHPDGKHIVSGGADKNIKVWDFSSFDRRVEFSWQLRAPQAVLIVQWRPPYWYSGKQENGNWQCTQIAASYNQEDPRIHIWDFRRPFVPYHVLDRYDTPASALLWKSESLLWSAGSAGMFTQTDINFVPKTMDQRSPNTLDIAPDGKILFFSEKRKQRRTSIEDVFEHLNQKNIRLNSKSEKPAKSQSTTYSSSEEPSLLNPSFRNYQRKSPDTLRLTKSLASTPPSVGSGGPVLGLEESLNNKAMYRSSQVAGIGYVEGLFDVNAFKLLACNYKAPEPGSDQGTTCNFHIRISEAFQKNAILAERTAQYRLSQSWQILALAVERELGDRAEENYQRRTHAASAEEATTRESLHSVNNGEEYSHPSLEGKVSRFEEEKLRTKSVASSALDNASNMTTPLAKPLPEPTPAPTAPVDFEPLQLPSPVWGKQPVRPVPGVSHLIKVTSPKSASKPKDVDGDGNEETLASAFEIEKEPQRSMQEMVAAGAGFVDMDRQMTERRAAMGNYRAIPRPLLRLDEPVHMTGAGKDAPHFDRHDSNESFQLFSASTDSSHRSQSMIGSFDSSLDSQKSASTPEKVHTRVGREDYGGDQEDSALVFDHEASLRSPAATFTSLPKLSDFPIEENIEQHVAPPPTSAIYRPDNPDLPTVHHEDFRPPDVDLRDSDNKDLNHTKTLEGPHAYMMSDYLPLLQKPSHLPPWSATAMFERLLDFHAYELHDLTLPAYLLLHLAPYLNHSVPRERATLILLQYHKQLLSHQLFSQAAELRNLCHADYPEVSELGLVGITPGGPWCTVCKKPSKGTKYHFCKRCNNPWGECPVCNGTGGTINLRSEDYWKGSVTAYKTAGSADALWGWCQECGHGGHVGCLRVWWEDEASEGACPTLGCLCDCVRGKRRDEVVDQQEERKKPGTVSRDDWRVDESEAVRRARGLVDRRSLGSKGLGTVPGSDIGNGRGALSLGVAGRSGSGGKKVRIVAPEQAKAGTGCKDEKTSPSAP